MPRKPSYLAILCLLGPVACDNTSTVATDASSLADAAPLDAEPATPDAVPPDAVPPDAVPPDAVPPDAMPLDAMPLDAMPLEPTRLEFPGFGTVGSFDPSLANDPSTTRVWMSYSAVNASAAFPTQNDHVVSTRLAYSDDSGTTWIDAGLVVNETLDVTLALAPPNDAGTWHNEVSDLVFDPGAPVAQRWKLMWHHYLVINAVRRFEHGWIGYKTAASPEALVDATEVKLFAAAWYDTGNDVAGGGSGSPLGGAPAMHIGEIDASLAACVVLTEPGMLATSDALYLALLCPKLSPVSSDITLLRCSAPCDPTSSSNWSYVGTVFDDQGAAALGYEKFSAPTLFSDATDDYIMVTPVASTPSPDFYSGCVGFRFADIDAATLASAEGTPTKVVEVSGDQGSFNGACDYDSASSGTGVVYSQAFLTDPVVFRIFASHTQL